jgi:beta-lactamase regulating signal transducer with metallopeptidase domain
MREQLILWGIAWSLLGTLILFLAKAITQRFSHPALRHLVWTMSFGSILIFPLLQPKATAPSNHVHTTACSAGNCPTSNGAISRILLTVWSAGSLFVLGRTFLAWRTLNRWRSRSATCIAPSENLAEALRGIELRIAQEQEPAVPITWGFRRPVILLPQNSMTWDNARISAALWHELGHIRRLDNLAQLLALLTCAIHWFNPLFWHASRQMEAAAEMAADDFALLSGVKPSTYAAELMAIASGLHGERRCAFAQTAMVKEFTLEDRLRSIINPSLARTGPAIQTRAKVALTVAGVSLGLLIPTSAVASRLHTFSQPAPPACLGNPI